MKKIVIDARMINHSGIGTFIKNILPYFSTSRLSSSCDGKYRIILLGDPDKLKTFGFETIPLNCPIYSASEQIVIPRILNKTKTDLYHATHYNIPVFYKGKILATIHDLIHLIYPEYLPLGKLGLMYANFMFNRAVKKSTRIITISENTKKDIIRMLGADEKKISVIYPGVSRKTFFPKDKLSPKKGGDYILSVGVIRPHKNTVALIEAFHKFLKSTGAELRLILVGWGKPPYINEVLKKISLLSLEDKVTIMEKISEEKELAELYRNAFMFVFPSLYEGFGLPPLEAMASGCPVISSGRASLAEVTGGGRGGYGGGGDNKEENAAITINPEDSDDIAGAMIKVFSDGKMREELIKKGLERASRFGWEETADKILRIYDELLY